MALRAGRAGRWTDRVEDAGAWVLLAAGLLLIVFAGARGIGVHEQLVDQARTDALDRTPATATLLNAAPTIGSDYAISAPVWAMATWRDRSGVSHNGSVTAPQGLDAGRAVRIWIDRSGSAVHEPTSDGEALGMAAITAVIIIVAGAGVLAALWGVLKRVTLSYNYAAWEREWLKVAPTWSRGEGMHG